MGSWFGYISVGLFISAAFFQMLKVLLNGNAYGISHLSIWTLLIGFTGMIFYVIEYIGYDKLLLSSYIGQLICWLVITKYKYFPRNY